jgi:hypothetical protein
MKEKYPIRDPAARLDEIVAEIGRLYSEADQIIDNYVGELSTPIIPGWKSNHEVLN